MTNDIDPVDRAFDRLRQIARPGGACCLLQTVVLRVLALEIVKDPNLLTREDWQISDDLIKQEFRRLHAEYPDAPVCPCHVKLLDDQAETTSDAPGWSKPAAVAEFESTAASMPYPQS
jgi:hypothetical protein